MRINPRNLPLKLLGLLALVLLLLLAVTVWRLARPQQFSTVVCSEAAAGDAPRVHLETVASGFAVPVFVTAAGDGSGRLFVVEKGGLVRIVKDGMITAEPFLDLSQEVTTAGEEGLLSIAFHPNYRRNGRFFAFYSARGSPRSVVAEFSAAADGNYAEPEGRVLLEVAQTEGLSIHKGGQLQFGPEGYLYISIGDGGEWPNDKVQDLAYLHGKIARIDVDAGNPYRVPRDNPFTGVAGARGEIWAYGFRNPWRFSVDPCGGRVFVADVGEASYEEINLVEPGGNYGWPLMEGKGCLPGAPYRQCGEKRFELPIYDYPHLALDPEGGNSVIGGYVYRGGGFPLLAGRYLFADFTSGRLWTLTQSEAKDSAGSYTLWRPERVLEEDERFTSFGEGEAGELYLLSASSGRLFQLVPEETSLNP
jgi:glucose/arabinose dehydrogenase